MAQKKEILELMVLEPKGTESGRVDIINGPNDWDMWLCLRRTKNVYGYYPPIPETVTFQTDQRIVIPPDCSSPSSFKGFITSMSCLVVDDENMIWEVEGDCREGTLSLFYFSAHYNSKKRTGWVKFIKN